MKFFPLLPFLLCALPRLALSCDDLTVRDSAFQEPRDVHRLSVIAAADDAEADKTFERLTAWLEEAGNGLNLQLFRLDPADSEVRWQDFGVPSAPGPEQVPAVLLTGYQHANSRAFFIEVWQPAPSDEDLAALAGSPVREQLTKLLPTHVAVLLYMRGNGSGESTAQTALDEVVNERLELAAPVSVLAVDREDVSEKLLVAFTGAGVEGPDWVGVVFGRGKFLNPPLSGSEVTAGEIRGLLDSVTASCTCLQQASKMGVDIPMVWDKSLDEKLVKFAVSVEDKAEVDDVAQAAEAKFEELLAPKTANAAPMESTSEASASDDPMQTTLWVLGAVLVILALSTVQLLRRRQA